MYQTMLWTSQSALKASHLSVSLKIIYPNGWYLDNKRAFLHGGIKPCKLYFLFNKPMEK